MLEGAATAALPRSRVNQRSGIISSASAIPTAVGSPLTGNSLPADTLRPLRLSRWETRRDSSRRFCHILDSRAGDRRDFAYCQAQDPSKVSRYLSLRTCTDQPSAVSRLGDNRSPRGWELDSVVACDRSTEESVPDRSRDPACCPVRLAQDLLESGLKSTCSTTTQDQR
jgi:hypothetical protein